MKEESFSSCFLVEGKERGKKKNFLIWYFLQLSLHIKEKLGTYVDIEHFFK